MRNLTRLWRRERKHGAACGVGVFGSLGFADDARGLIDLLGRHDKITHWAKSAGVDLQESIAGLQAVEALIDNWREILA